VQTIFDDASVAHDEAARAGAGALGHADVTVATECTLEEEGVAAGCLLLIEETENAEGRQQIARELNRVNAGPKDDSGKSMHCACAAR
jgi:hypothetical protein